MNKIPSNCPYYGKQTMLPCRSGCAWYNANTDDCQLNKRVNYDTEETRNYRRKIAISILLKIYAEDIPCLTTIQTAWANEDWETIYKALESTEMFINELKRTIR